MNFIEKISWLDASKIIEEANREFFNAVNKYLGKQAPDVYLAKYPYGEKLLNNGVAMIYDDDNTIPINSEIVPLEIRDDLCYSPTIPVGIVIKKSIELYMDFDPRSIPFGIFRAGDVFGLNANLRKDASFDKGDFWQISAGARHTFLTTKLSANSYLGKISREIKTPLIKPDNYLDHWKVFKAIHSVSDTEWETQVIYLTKDWLIDREDLNWKAFRAYLFEYSWYKNRFWRSSYLHDLAYSGISAQCQNVQQKLFTNRTVKHLIGVCNSMYPGFIFSDSDELIPYTQLFGVLCDVYGDDGYLPNFITPGYCSDNEAVYYSLAINTSLESYLTLSKHSRRTNEVSELIRFIDSLKRVIANMTLDTLQNNEHKMLEKFLKSKIVGFHCKHESYDLVNSSEIPSYDRKLREIISSKKDKKIAYNSAFFSGLLGVFNNEKDC